MCSRCLELKDKVIGRTDESGVTLPPLHPRCRCAIMYREIGEKHQKFLQRHEELMREFEENHRKREELGEKIQHERDRRRRAALYAEQVETERVLNETTRRLKQIRVQAAKNKVVLTAGLSRAYPAEDIAQIVAYVSNAPENIRALWNLANAEMEILDICFQEIAHYDTEKCGIKLDLAKDRAGVTNNPYKITFHEIGHLLDYFMGYRSVNYKNGLFAKTLREEAARRSEDFEAVSRELRKIPLEIRHEISDIWHGATSGKVNEGIGHYEPDYWIKDEASNLSKEAFAHMFRATIQSPDSLNFIKKYFPNSYSVFIEMIDDFLKEVTK